MNTTLTGRHCMLKPFDLAQDCEELYHLTRGEAISIDGRLIEKYDCDELVWRWLFAGPFSSLDEFRAYMTPQARADTPYAICFCVYDTRFSKPQRVGVVNIMNYYPEHRKAELGGIFYSPLAQRTGINTEATLLLLTYLFETLTLQRVEWKCNALNERSRKAALSMGFVFEGIQQKHMIIKGKTRDTVAFTLPLSCIASCYSTHI